MIASRISEVKADGVRKPEGSRPGHVMASIEVTTGVRDQGMYRKGLPGNLGCPYVSLWRRKGARISGQETKSRRGCGSPAALASPPKGGDTNVKEGQSRVSGEDSEK